MIIGVAISAFLLRRIICKEVRMLRLTDLVRLPDKLNFSNRTNDGGTGFFPTASLSAPIIRGKLWFFASYSPQIFA